MRLRCALFALPLLAAACAGGAPKELTAEQVCLAHHKGDAAEEARCRLRPENQRGSPPDARPQELPIRVPGPGDAK